MKTGKNIFKFTVIFVILSICFNYLRTSLIEAELYTPLMITGFIFMLLFYLCGLYFGYKEESPNKMNIWLKYNIAAFISFIGVSLLWNISGLSYENDNLLSIAVVAIIWIMISTMRIPFYLKYRKKCINGIDREEIFD